MLDPATTVRAFYTRAAAHDYAGAWALTGPGFRQQLGGFDAFRGAMSTLRSIEFRRLDTLAQSTGAAEVAIETVARHTDRVDHCRGTLRVLRGAGGGWQIGGAGVGCSSDAGAP